MHLYISTFDKQLREGVFSEIKIETNITFFVLQKIKYQINFEKKWIQIVFVGQKMIKYNFKILDSIC